MTDNLHGVDRGVWQINTYNAQAAHDIYKSQGFGAWSTYNSGAWKKTSTGRKITETVALA